MKFKHIHFIINPVSGKEEPILSYINKAMTDIDADWEVSVTRKNLAAADIARSLIGNTDLIAVYGGDGCVTDVASALHGTDMPMAIIPGGTANVMAKELGVPIDSVEALALLGQGKSVIKPIDMGLVNGRPFLLRVNLGIMADMITDADRTLKNNIGQLAYGITTVKTVAQANSVDYDLEIDGEKTSTAGVALTVTNAGHAGIGNLALQPGISVTDGYLDVILLKEKSLGALIKAAGSALFEQETDALQHWKAKKVTISAVTEQSYICDDIELTGKRLNIEVVPESIRIVLPK